MIDLHTHSLLSDGDLLPSELARRAEVLGLEAIAITDHADSSNIDWVLPRIVKVSKSLNRFWRIKVIPGVEITHVPLQQIEPLVKYARKEGAEIVVVHGETKSEPVLTGTNRRAIECKVDILAHPGYIKEEDAKLARKNKVFLELSTRSLHAATNSHVLEVAKRVGAKLVLNTDAHQPEDLFCKEMAEDFLKSLGLKSKEIEEIFTNSRLLVKRLE